MGKNVMFVHPDLGIGGAERLVVDAGVALKMKGHEIQFVTAHHDPKHCFPETVDDNLSVEVAGDWLPRSFFGFFHALCAYIRMIYIALYVATFWRSPDVIVCDQISACIPVFRVLMPSVKVIFYCHFPDQLLTTRKTKLKALYRAPLDWLEQWTTGLAHVVLVNSLFTGGVFASTFPSLAARGVIPDVLYPTLNLAAFDEKIDDSKIKLNVPRDKKSMFLSINRYERKKNVPLVLYAFNHLHTLTRPEEWTDCHLVICGGYDTRVVENREHYEELVRLAKKLGLEEKVTFLRSPSDSEKRWLLRRAVCLVYTPAREHFGIVPCEAMYSGTPVVACNSGGPLETVQHDVTGLLADPDSRSFAACLLRFVERPDLKETMGAAGRRRVRDHFSFDVFADRLAIIVAELSGGSGGGDAKKRE